MNRRTWLAAALAGAGLAGADALAAPSIGTLRATRAQGVAPLAVLFDATATTDPSVARPFHDLRFEWDFGDATAGTWALSGRARNRAEGPLAGHLFERPGTHVVRLTVTNPDGEVATAQVQIDVLDPATRAWAGRYCYSNTSNHDGCPAGFTRVSNVSTQAATLQGRLGPNSAHLFHRGHTFSMGSVNLHGSGDVGLVGAYGTGARPVFTGTASFVPGDDWRVEHLDLRTTTADRPFRADPVDADDFFTVFDVEATGYAGCFSGYYSPDAPRVSRGLAVVDFTCRSLSPTGGSGWSIFLEVRDAMLLGVDMDNCSPSGGSEGNLRFVFAEKVVVQHSRLVRSCHNTGAKNPISIRSCGIEKSPVRCGGGNPNRWVVVSDNALGHFAGSAPGSSLIRTCTTDGCEDTDVSSQGNHSRDVLIERNYAWAVPEGGGVVFAFVESESGDITVRNNAVDLTAATLPTSYLATQPAHGPPDGGVYFRDRLRVYNNTLIVNNASGRNVVGCSAQIGSGHECRNNLLYVPGASSVAMAQGSAGVFTDRNLCAGPCGSASFTGYPFADDPYPGAPAAIGAYALRSANPVASGANPVGAALPIDGNGLDANLACRGASGWDVGAFEYGAQACGAGVPAAPYLLP